MAENSIRTTVRSDRDVVIVQMCLNGEPCTWIEYNAEQLDRLIENLKKARSELKAPPDESLAEIAPGE